MPPIFNCVKLLKLFNIVIHILLFLEENNFMKTSSKIILLLFAITSIASIILFPNLANAFQLNEKGLSLNFSVLSYITLGLTILSNIFATILFFRFLKTLSINKVLFFSTLPFTLLYGVSLFSLAYLSNLDNPTAKGVKTILNISNENQYNTILWGILLTILYVVILFIVYFFVTKPVYKMEKIIDRLGDGKIKEKRFNLGGGKQFSQISHSLLKINNTFNNTNNDTLTYSKFPKQIIKNFGEENLSKLQNGAPISKKVNIVFCKILSNISHSKNIDYNILKFYINNLEPLIKRFNGISIEIDEEFCCGIFFKSEEALDFAHSVCRLIKIKSKHLEFKIIPLIIVDNNETQISINEKGKVFANDQNFNVIYELMEFAQKTNTRLVFTNRVLDNLPSNYLLKYRFLGYFENLEINAFESLEVYSRKKRELLDRNKQAFEKAVLFFKNGEKQRAQIIFENILKENPNDKVSYLYFNQCKN